MCQIYFCLYHYALRCNSIIRKPHVVVSDLRVYDHSIHHVKPTLTSVVETSHRRNVGTHVFLGLNPLIHIAGRLDVFQLL